MQARLPGTIACHTRRSHLCHERVVAPDVALMLVSEAPARLSAAL
jgi:hypothetical protein